MKTILLLSFLLFNTLCYANLTVGNIPVTKTGGTVPAVEDSGLTYVNGNLGIGSINPGKTLDIQGTVRISGTSQISFSPNGGILTNPSGTIISSNMTLSAPLFQMTTSPVSGYILTTDGAGNGTWQVAPAATQWQAGNVGINTTSNVGIGSVNPGTILDVNGTIRTTGFKLSTNPSSGYVLTSNTVGVGTWMPVSSSGSGTVTSIGVSSPNSTLSIGSTPVTTSGTITADLNLATANTWTGQQLFNTANVGINSATPGQRLDVQGTIRATAYLGNGSGLTGIPGSNYWNLGTGGNLGINTTTNNVGIGTLNPGKALDVQGTLNGPFGMRVQNIDNESTSTTSISVLNDAGNGIAISAAGSGSVAPNLLSFAVTSGQKMSFADKAATVYETIDSSNGFVGIGSVSPGTVLDITGTARMTGFNIVSGAGAGKVLTSDSSGNGTWGTNSGTNYWTTGTGGNIGIATTNTVGIGTTFGNGNLVVMSGNVGIGTWNPSAFFQVGTGASTNATINSTGTISTSSGVSISAVSASALALSGANTGISGTSAGAGSFLTVAGSASTTGGLKLVSTTANGTTDFIKLSVGNNSSVVGLIVQDNSGTANIGIGTTLPSGILEVGAQKFDILSGGNVGIGSITPGQKFDVQGTVRGISSGTCTTLYQCNGGVDAGVIQTSACNLCPAGSCVAMNGCF